MTFYHVLAILMMLATGWVLATAATRWARERRLTAHVVGYALLTVGGILILAELLGRIRAGVYVPMTWKHLTGTLLGLVGTTVIAIHDVRARRRAGR